MARPVHRGGLRRLLSCRRGNIATMAALLAPVGIALAALAVDEASLYVERRDAQSITDIAAIAATQNIANADSVARATFSENGFPKEALPPHVKVQKGRYFADASLPIPQRFQAGGMPANAVRVDFRKTGRLFFAEAFSRSPQIATAAIATRAPIAAFSIGSRLASLDGGLVNAILGGLTGSTLSLSAMDYDALLSSDIDLLTFFGPLATRLDLKAATYDNLLDSKVSVSEIAAALGAVDGLSTRAVSALDAIARATRRSGAGKFALSDLVDLRAAGAAAAGTRLGGLKARVNALQMIMAAAAIANGGHQIDVDLGGGVPGLLEANLLLAVGEPPQGSAWFAVGDGGEIVRTAQTRLRLVVQIGGSGSLLGVRIRLPLYLDIAYAEAKLASVTCPTGRADSLKVAIDARPGVADLRVADMDETRLSDFRDPIPLRPASLVKLPLIEVTGSAHAQIGNEDYTRLTFDHDDIAAGTVRTVSTSNITQSLVASLIGDLDPKVQVLGLGLGLPGDTKETVRSILAAAAPDVDRLLLDILHTLGISIGEADIAVAGASCGRAVLVQ